LIREQRVVLGGPLGQSQDGGGEPRARHPRHHRALYRDCLNPRAAIPLPLPCTPFHATHLSRYNVAHIEASILTLTSNLPPRPSRRRRRRLLLPSSLPPSPPFPPPRPPPPPPLRPLIHFYSCTRSLHPHPPTHSLARLTHSHTPLARFTRTECARGTARGGPHGVRQAAGHRLRVLPQKIRAHLRAGPSPLVHLTAAFVEGRLLLTMTRESRVKPRLCCLVRAKPQ